MPRTGPGGWPRRRDTPVRNPPPRKESAMEARLNLFENSVVAKVGKYINSAGRAITESTLPAATQELVKIRASQINGCGMCLDMHTKDAAHAGESQVRRPWCARSEEHT